MYNSIGTISMIYDIYIYIYIRIWFEMMQVILISHSMSQCFRCWIDIIIMTTWTCHCIDHIRCCTCLNFNITSSSRSNSWYGETYSWTIQICRIPIDELMHSTWNKINDWPRLIFWMTTWTQQITTWTHCISFLRFILSTEKAFINGSRFSSTKRASFHVEYVHWKTYWNQCNCNYVCKTYHLFVNRTRVQQPFVSN